MPPRAFPDQDQTDDIMKRLFALLLLGATALTGCQEPAPTPATSAAPAAPANPHFASETIHIGVVASDLEASLRFYTEAIGMQRLSSFEIDEDFGRRSGLTGGVPVRVEVLQLGTGETATQWKVMTFGERAEARPNTHIHDHVGMQYVTLFVNDLNAAVARLEEHGVALLGETPTPLNDGRHFVLVKDPDDTFIELIGPMEE
jgi:catechol 2,3-dioxygenase-like lactoylglutathione lyase family enzyme